ncbi:MAG: chorismate--pyruvate lyase family protein [Gammaproteobacteria bacterium]
MIGTLQGGARQLAFLGSRPLGDVLFADKTAYRQNLTVAQIPADDKRFHLAIGGDWVKLRALWARRSLFHFRDKPLLVAEIFLCDPRPISCRAYCR